MLRSFVLLLLLAGCSLGADSTRPNLIFLFADDQNTLSVGCYGNKDVQTPQMDKLGEDGIIFDKHYNTTAICMASRANVLTGMYEYKTGCNFTHGNMKPEIWEQSYPVLLRKNGYLTAFAGKFGIEVEGRGLPKEDFDTWGGGPGQTSYQTDRNKSIAHYAKKYPHSTLAYGAFGQDFIKEAKKSDKPFCLSISFKSPHKPAISDPRFDDLYKGKTFTKPANFGREFGEHMAPQSKTGRQYPRFTKWGYSDDYDTQMAIYYRQVYGIDVALGMIRQELEEQGLADNTVIIYTSDNGYICGSHGYGSKVLPMEESARVPLIIYDPRSKNSGKKLRCDRLTANIDFASTLLELGGVEIPKQVDGQSLLPLLEDPTTGGHEQISFINVFGPMSVQSLSCITREHKYSYWWFQNEKMKPTEELFDLINDPLELKNLAATEEPSPELLTMRKRYQTALSAWKENAVPYNDYTRQGTLFDPALSWTEKKPFLRKKKNAKANKKKENQ